MGSYLRVFGIVIVNKIMIVMRISMGVNMI